MHVFVEHNSFVLSFLLSRLYLLDSFNSYFEFHFRVLFFIISFNSEFPEMHKLKDQFPQAIFSLRQSRFERINQSRVGTLDNSVPK